MNNEQLNEELQTQEESQFKKYFCTVTPLSKYLTMVLFVALPFLCFWAGLAYGTMLHTGGYNLRLIQHGSSETKQHTVITLDPLIWEFAREENLSLISPIGAGGESVVLKQYKTIEPIAFSGAEIPLYGTIMILENSNKDELYRINTIDLENYRYYNAKDVTLRDVTNDGEPELLYTLSGQQGASGGCDYTHILTRELDGRLFVDIGGTEIFCNYFMFGFEWTNYASEEYVLRADPDSERECRGCESSYRFSLLKWNVTSEKFEVIGAIKSQQTYSTAHEALLEITAPESPTIQELFMTGS